MVASAEKLWQGSLSSKAVVGLDNLEIKSLQTVKRSSGKKVQDVFY